MYVCMHAWPCVYMCGCMCTCVRCHQVTLATTTKRWQLMLVVLHAVCQTTSISSFSSDIVLKMGCQSGSGPVMSMQRPVRTEAVASLLWAHTLTISLHTLLESIVEVLCQCGLLILWELPLQQLDQHVARVSDLGSMHDGVFAVVVPR